MGKEKHLGKEMMRLILVDCRDKGIHGDKYNFWPKIKNE